MNVKTIHEGRNVKRIREILGIKQDALAVDLGISQQAISALEQKEALDKDIIEKISKILKVPADSIKNFSEDAALSIINNTFNDHSVLNGVLYNPTFNPLDKYIEQVEENKKLYEALLKSEREKIALLEKMIEKK